MEGAWGNILIFALFIAIFYLMILRPQQKRQKQMSQMLNALKKGDQVVTIGGLHGTIDQIDDEQNTVIISSGGTRLTFEKRSVNNVVGEKV